MCVFPFTKMSGEVVTLEIIAQDDLQGDVCGDAGSCFLCCFLKPAALRMVYCILYFGVTALMVIVSGERLLLCAAHGSNSDIHRVQADRKQPIDPKSHTRRSCPCGVPPNHTHIIAVNEKKQNEFIWALRF